jgi:hypothetical protein
MPQLSPAAQASPSDVNVVPTSPVPGKNQAARTGKAWQIQQESPRPAPVAAAPAATPSSNGSSSLPAAAAAQVEKETAPQHEPLAPTILAPVDTAPSAEGGDFVFSPSPSPTPQMEEESIPWENLAADTKDHSKEQDTVPGPKKGSSSKLRAGKRRMSEAERRRLLWAAGGACAAGVLILAIVLWLAFFGDSAKPGKVDSTLPAPARLIVSQAGKENTFRTIQEAVARAKPFDHIVLADTTITEQITLIDARNLTIEPADGVSVVWRCPDKPTNKQLLYVSQCEGLQIQGITFDGRDKVDAVITLFGHCPGLSLKNLRVEGIKTHGIVVMNCAGRAGRDVAIHDVEITTAKETDAALALFAYTNVASPKINQHISVRNCRIEGNFKKPVVLLGAAVQDLDWDNNTYKSAKDVSANQLPKPK